MFWNPEFQYFVTFDDSRKARWQTKKFVFSLFLKANSSKIQNFFNPEEICSIKLPEYQWKYSITHQKLVKKHQFKANLMILSLFWGILREKNVFVICEIFSHPMFSWHTFPDQGRSKYHPLCNGSHGSSQKILPGELEKVWLTTHSVPRDPKFFWREPWDPLHRGWYLDLPWSGNVC